ncbi:PREDICTED: molybdopterin synthase sulfur carrier subunit-like isoform X1 [Poecilia mexicana]|uniref:molybdopterin synthase sulfur carrier subunit-like isoform X1 n=1 Tax=Poecilia mexicana TaxID=48701 RepID=UPI00072E13C4|nr:PREDICTED: molybdopterin synthase sulfur carrier subunit-like isoform X1 [Poecilia mexicana]
MQPSPKRLPPSAVTPPCRGNDWSRRPTTDCSPPGGDTCSVCWALGSRRRIGRSKTVTGVGQSLPRSAELTGLREEELVAVPTPISSRDLWALLLRKQPRLVALQGRVVLAVRQQYVAIGNQQLSLQDGDEVAVVPPLSGG